MIPSLASPTFALYFQDLNLLTFFPRNFDLQSFAQVSAAQMLNCAAEGIGIAALAWILLRVLGRQNSGTRFAVWFSALMGIALLPFLSHPAAGRAGMTQPAEIMMPASWAAYVFLGWALIATVGLIRIGAGFWRLRHLRKSCTSLLPSSLDPLLQKSLREFDSPRSAAICVSDKLRVPTAIGFLKPMVVFPPWALLELSAVELNTILLHELAHLRRWDDWTNLVQKVLGALLFFHPAVWWLEKKLALEREMACDDVVLTQTQSPRAYAECLVSLAEKSFLRRGFALAQAAVGRLHHMSVRVAQILDEKRPSATKVWRPAPVLLTGLSIACLMAVSDAPRLVSFENSPASPMTEPAAMALAHGSQTGSGEAEAASRMASAVVPAKFVMKTGSKPVRVFVTARTKPVASARTEPPRSEVIPARTAQPSVILPRLIRSSLSDNAVIPQTMVLIMRRARYDDSGAVVWDFCVWQVTVFSPAKDQPAPASAAKST